MLACDLEHVARAGRTHIQRFNRMFEIVDGAGQGGEMKNTIYVTFGIERLANIPLAEFEPRVAPQMLDIPGVAGDEIIQPDDLVAFGDQPVAQVGADEAGRA